MAIIVFAILGFCGVMSWAWIWGICLIIEILAQMDS